MKTLIFTLLLGLGWSATFKLQDPLYQNNETLHYHIQKNHEHLEWFVTVNTSATSNAILRTIEGNLPTRIEQIIIDKTTLFPLHFQSWTKDKQGILWPESHSVWDLKQHTLSVKFGNQPWSTPSPFPAKNYLFSPDVVWDLLVCLPLSEHWKIRIPSDFVTLTLQVDGIESISIGKTNIPCFKLAYLAEPHLAMFPLPRFEGTYWISTGKTPRIMKAIAGTAFGRSQIELKSSSVLSIGSQP